MRGIKIFSLSMALLAALCSGFTAAAADDLTPPAALSSPGGMVYATVGEPVEFTVCGESFVGGEIEIDPIGAPDWIGRVRGDGDCETYTATPDAPGVHTLWFRIVDDENDMETAYAVTIEARGSECQEFPTCSFDPPGPIMIVAGETRMIDFCFDTVCPVEELRFIEVSFPRVGFCTPGLPMPNPNGSGYCATITCSPTLTDVGTHFLAYQVLDDDNGFARRCSIFIEVSAPEVCMEPPSCSFDPPGPIKLTVGQTGTVYFDFFTTCVDNGLSLGMASGDADFCELVDLEPLGAGAMRATYSCTPEAGDVGMRTLTVSARDTTNNMTTQCSLMIEVNPSPDGPPTCEFIPASGEIEIFPGGNDQFQICVQGVSLDNQVRFTALDAPSWILDQAGSSATFTNNGCAFGDVHPPIGAAGQTFTVHYLVEDLDAGTSTECEFDIIVPVPPPPVCEFVPASGSIEIPPGGNDQFQICVSAGIPGNQVRFTALDAPSWILDQASSSVTYNDNGCAFGDVHPPQAVAGETVTVNYLVEDLDSGAETTCSFDIIVDCPDPPTCWFTESDPLTVQVGEPIDFEFCGYSGCDENRTRIEMIGRPPFIDPAGHEKGAEGETLCLPITGVPGPEHAGNSYPVRVRTTNINTGEETECTIRIIVTGPACPPPVCTIGPSESMNAVRGQQITLTACGEPGCPDGAVRIEAVELPEFCDPFDAVTGEPGEELCIDLSCTIPMDTPDGEYPVVIRVTDLDSGESVVCGSAIVVGAPPVCIEEEPNNELADCTVLDAQSCLNIDCGAFIAGYLDDSGEDVDFYCVEGLQPGGFYNVRIINGVSCDLEPTCAMALCVDDQGTRIGSGGSEGAECIADDNGTLLIGVTGCGDYDLDGQADDDVEGVGGIGHGGRGSYQLLLSLQVPAVTEFACHADMNGDGIVDAGDLGLLIGVFGETCDP